MKFAQIPTTTLVYVAAILLLGGVYAVQETRSPQRNAIPIPDIADQVDRIVMERDAPDSAGNGRVELTREGETWRVWRGLPGAAPGGDTADAEADSEGQTRWYRADSAVVDALLQDLRGLSAADVMSTRGNYEEYGLSEGSRERLRFFVGDTQPLALEFGSAAAAGDGVYGRINGGGEIVLLPQSLASAIVTDPEELRDTAILRIPEEEITQVEIRSPEYETLSLRRERPGDSSAAAAGDGDPVWRIEPERDDESIALGRVRDLFTELNPLRAQEFLAEEPQGSPFAEIVVRRGADQGVEEIRIWPPDEDGRYPVRTTAAEDAIVIPEWRARRLLLGLERYFAPFATEAATD